MKLLTHFTQMLQIVITFEIPFYFNYGMSSIAADPKEAMYNLECLLGQYFKNTFQME